MRRCYRGVALVLGAVLMTSNASFNSCSFGTLTAYAAEDALTEATAAAEPAEVMETAFQTEVQTGEENVETEIPAEEPTPVPTQAVGNSFSLEEQEYQVLLKIVEAEAGGEDTTGKMLVANVIMNRVRSGHFPNTVEEVVYQKHNGKAQFSPTVDGRIDSVNVSQDTVDAVARVMNGEDSSNGALYFRSVRSKCGWFDRALTRVVEHGNHIFYAM